MNNEQIYTVANTTGKLRRYSKQENTKHK